MMCKESNSHIFSFLLGKAVNLKSNSKPKTIQPKNDPNGEGCVVLNGTRLNRDFSARGDGCGIVVDRILSSYLRSHQKKGVIFMFYCLWISCFVSWNFCCFLV